MNRLKKYIFDRYWFGYWRATYCSAHQLYDVDCRLCKSGNWVRNTENNKLFGKL